MLCATPACFSTFFQSTMVPTLVENSYFFNVLVLYKNRTGWILVTLRQNPAYHKDSDNTYHLLWIVYSSKQLVVSVQYI